MFGGKKLQQETESQVWINGINDANKLSLMAWVKETKTNLVQVNGQRKYGGPPPGWIGDAPGSGSEVFISKIPQECYENQLIPLFQSVGKLYEFRLMMTFSGLNRGFAYARYTSRRHAYAAIAALNGYEMTNGCRILVCRSTEKCEIILDGLPCMLEKLMLTSVLKELTPGVEEVFLHPSRKKSDEIMAVVKYCSHRAAALAKKSLREGSHLLYGQPLTVDWLKSELKQKLESSKPSILRDCHLVQQMCNLDGRNIDNQMVSATDCLDALCQRWKLGRPLFMIKFSSMSPCGWQRFWYRVVIPNYSTPFSGYEWVIGENLIPTEKHEKAREVVAKQILTKLDAGLSSYLLTNQQTLGLNLGHSPCWAN
ncbi:dead end protein homolog 1-like [Pelobates fuscus]|uniref:dead end protein homolog 1-like n=1 Tax=Pelobates fuscus TaxID=191477 RepID=UPI002FE4F6FC